MDDVITFLSAAPPRQTSVFVVFVPQEESIHVLSMDVSAKYSIVRAMRSELVDQIAENGSGNGRVNVGDGLFATSEQHRLLQHIDELMSSDSYYKDSDKAGFYNGLPGRTIMSRFCPEEAVAGLATIDMMCPYTRYLISEERLREEMDVIPVVRDAVHGPVELVGGGADGKLAVSMNMRHLPFLPYIITKIDLLCGLTEHQFHDEYIFCEKMLSSQMNQEELEQVRSNAAKIMGILVNHPTGYEPVDPFIHSTISSSLARQWTVRMHDHIVID